MVSEDEGQAGCPREQECENSIGEWVAVSGDGSAKTDAWANMKGKKNRELLAVLDLCEDIVKLIRKSRLSMG